MTVRRGRLSRSEVAALPTPKLRELDFQRQLVGTKPPGLAIILGWEHVHFRPAMTKHGWRTAGTGSMAAGWPDLVLVRPRDRRLIFAELKADGAKATPDQERVLEVLRSVVTTGGTLAAIGRSGYPRVGEELQLPRVDVYIWRPADWDLIEQALR